MWLTYVRLAARALAGHKFRSTLTIVSITIGAFAIVLMSSLAQSGLRTLSRGIEDLGGARLIMVGPKKPERNEAKKDSYSRGVTLADRDDIFTKLPHVETSSMFARVWTKDATTDTGTTTRSDVIGSDAAFFNVFTMPLADGRTFTEAENAEHAKVCIVGETTASKLWTKRPIGHMLHVDGVHCRVIGVLAHQDHGGVGFGWDWNDLVVVPMESLAETDAAGHYGTMLIKTDDPAANDTVVRIINALLVARHHGVDDFWILDFRTTLEKFHRIFTIMEIIVGFIAGIALLIGGVGVMNIMLVSVSERVREIGIRKAIGASPADIGAQFLTEAVFLAGTGGILGVGGGIGASIGAGAIVRHFMPTWHNVIASGAAITASVVCLCIGIVFGYFPARRASKLHPVMAMRR